jgi:putative transposase
MAVGCGRVRSRCLAWKVDRGITSVDVIDRLAEPFAMQGVPEHVRSNKGPESIAQGCWLNLVGIGTLDI